MKYCILAIAFFFLGCDENGNFDKQFNNQYAMTQEGKMVMFTKGIGDTYFINEVDPKTIDKIHQLKVCK
jgi:hypothetical protein